MACLDGVATLVEIIGNPGEKAQTSKGKETDDGETHNYSLFTIISNPASRRLFQKWG